MAREKPSFLGVTINEKKRKEKKDKICDVP